MPTNEMPAARPALVRLVAREGTLRATAARQRSVFALLACIGFAIFAVESSRETVLAAVARPLCLLAAAVGVVGVVWVSLAVRWVDRHGRWA